MYNKANEAIINLDKLRNQLITSFSNIKLTLNKCTRSKLFLIFLFSEFKSLNIYYIYLFIHNFSKFYFFKALMIWKYILIEFIVKLDY